MLNDVTIMKFVFNTSNLYFAFFKIESIGSYLASPGSVTEWTHLFIGEVDSTLAGGIHGLDAEGEDIKTHVMEANEAFAAIESGRIITANCLLPLRWLQLNRSALRERWLAA